MNKSYFLQGTKVGLNKLTVEAMNANYFNWLNDTEVTNGIEAGVFPSTQEDIENYVRNANIGKESVLFGIFDRETSSHVGNIRVSSINQIHRTCMLGIIIGEASARGKGFGLEATQLLVNYIFGSLNMNKIWLYVFDDNATAKKMYEKLGFITEGNLKQQFFKNGRYHDMFVMSLFKK